MRKYIRLGIAPFPQFEPISLQHKEEIDRFNHQLNNNYSDFNFVSLFSLNDNDTLRISNLNDNLVVAFSDSVSGENLVSLLGTNKINQSFKQLLLFSQQELHTDHSTFVPKITVKAITNPKLFKILANRDNDDYLYKIDETLTLKGNAFASLRRKINLCQRQHKPKIIKLTTKDFDSCWQLATQQQDDQIAKVGEDYNKKAKTPSVSSGMKQYNSRAEGTHKAFQKYHPANGVDFYSSLQRDISGLEKIFVFWEKLELDLYGIKINNNLSAFIVLEKIPQKTLLIHHFASDHQIKGLAEFIFFSIANLFKDKFDLINFEQDLGISGLRRFKNSLQPCYLLKKFIVKQ